MTAIALQRPSNRIGRSPAGSVVVFVLLTVAIAFLLGLTYLSTCTSVTDVARILKDHSRARQVAESGLAVTIDYMKSDLEWKSNRPNGTWIENASLLDGQVTVIGSFDPDVLLDVNNASFETLVGQLANPPLVPPMSGLVGQWELSRTALIQTGTTVPHVGVEKSLSSTDGVNRAFITFGATVSGSGQLAQTLTEHLEAHSTYSCSVDITVTGLPPLSGSFGIRIVVNGVVIATTSHAFTLQLPALPNQLPDPPSSLPTDSELTSLLTLSGIGVGSAEKYTLSFTTSDSPPSGPIRVELFATSAGLASGVMFDNVQFRKESLLPVTLTATSNCEDASYRVTASLVKEIKSGGIESFRIVRWQDSNE